MRWQRLKNLKILQRNRWKRIILPIFISTILILVLPTLILGELIYSASRNSNYDDIEGMAEFELNTVDDVSITYWSTGVNYEKVVLLIHGHFDNSRLVIERYGPIFRELNHDIVSVDLRNHGRSEHSPPVTMGIDESQDVSAVLEWMQEKWSNITIFGTSMGSIAAVLAHQSSKIGNQLILDSSFHDPIEVMNNNFEKNYIFQPWRYLIVQYLTNLRFSRDFPNVLNILENITIPTLVAHGSQDVESSPSFLSEVDNLQNSNIMTVLIEGAEHSRLHTFDSFVTAVSTLLEDA